MTARLNFHDADFTTALEALLDSRNETVADVAPVVRSILDDVRARGDAALLELTAKFDRLTLLPPPEGEGRGGGRLGKTKESGTEQASPPPNLPPPGGGVSLRFTAEEIAAATKACDPAVLAALKLAAERIRAYHDVQRPQNHRYVDDAGLTLGWQYAPLASVGLYVPGGKASYPSSVLMNAIPAVVAGVPRIAMVVPTPDGVVNPAILAAAHIAGVTEIYRIGGAQAVAALAYGTATIAPVAKIVGPGNAYVAEAKRQVYGKVGIDTIAGPSEILVVADAKNNPHWIAADLLSQAEHDEMAQSILITDDAAFADAVAAEIESILVTLPKAAIARAAWENHGGIVLVKRLEEALPIIATIAPEHLELAIDHAAEFAARVVGAGAIFLGRHTPEAVGDYIAGPSHVLPTSRAARFASGLSVFDFINRTSLIGAPEHARALLEAAATLADAEGLAAHALSLRCRV